MFSVTVQHRLFNHPVQQKEPVTFLVKDKPYINKLALVSVLIGLFNKIALIFPVMRLRLFTKRVSIFFYHNANVLEAILGFIWGKINLNSLQEIWVLIHYIWLCLT